MTVQQKQRDTHSDWFRADQELLDRFRKGDQEALGSLFLRHHEGAVAFAVRLGANRESAEDIASEAFLDVVSAIAKGKGPTVSMGLYLRSAVRNGFIRRGKEEKHSVVVEDLEEFLEPVPFTPMPEDDAVVEAFKALPERWQNIIWLRTIDQCRTAEAAAMLGISPGAATLLYRRARAGLRERYLEVLGASDEYVCIEFRTVIGLHANGALRGKAKLAFDRHLEECSRCRRSVKNLSNVSARFAAIIPLAGLGFFARPSKSSAALLSGRVGFAGKIPALGTAVAVLAVFAVVIAGSGQAEGSATVPLDRTSAGTVQIAEEKLSGGECNLFFTGERAAEANGKAFFEVRNSSAERCEVLYLWEGDELRPPSDVAAREYFFTPRAGTYEVHLITSASERTFVMDLH